MANNTINKEEIEKFNRLAEEWRDPEGKVKPLHKFNPIRIEYLKESIVAPAATIVHGKPGNSNHG